ncbi:MAG: hypothetical protein GVY13_07935 [Alphaproteobacteria bacterium]|jgi:hypothetical protein|nr:hypothetical protein [Alphaproteobacteria bacterium]
MPDTLPIINELWQSYPQGSVEKVKTDIGGRVDYDWVDNTCAIRVSRALNYSGQPVPAPNNRYGLNVISGADGKWYAFRVREFKKYLSMRYGAPSISKTSSIGRTQLRAAFEGRCGIIAFDVRWANSTGHLTLWDSKSCADTCYFNIADAVHLWETGYGPPRPVKMITG